MKKAKIAIFIVTSFIVGGGIGFFSGKLFPKTLPAEQKVQINENLTTLKFATLHTLCMHETVYTETEQMFFNDLKQIKEAFPSWKIKDFSNDAVLLQKESHDYCPDHYFVKLEENKLTVQNLNGLELAPIDVSLYDFSEEEFKKLSLGIYLNGKDEYTAFIEDFTS